MALYAYYDGSGKKDNPNCKVITLSAVAAPESIWQEFEPLWGAALARHGVRKLHMSELMCFGGEFTKRRGWNQPKRIALLEDLLKVVNKFTGRHLLSYVCSVDLGAWRKAKREKSLLPSPEVICVDACVGGLELAEGESARYRPVLLYFDRSEDFIGVIKPRWDKEHKTRGTKFSQIRTIEPVVEAKDYYPIQCADMLAWFENCRRRNELESWELFGAFVAAQSANQTSWFYGYNDLVREYPCKRLMRDKNAEREFEKFDQTMTQLLKVPHSEIKAKLDAERARKAKSKSRKKGDAQR
jgi:hypothetical protein